MTTKQLRFLTCLVLVGFSATRAWAVVLFTDDFNDAGHAANWTTNAAPTANADKQQATFAFNYADFGIPAAPGSADTLGLRLRANLPIVGGVEVTNRPAGTTSGLSLSPTGKDFGTNYKATFYVWSNTFGATNGQGLADANGSEGGTANVTFAVGTNGAVPVVVGQPGLVTNGQMDGIGFSTTNDGALTADYRVYPKTGVPVPITTVGVYAAGSMDSANAFYAGIFPSQSAPAVQQTIATNEYPSDANPVMSGSTLAGSFGFAWHKVEIAKNNNIATWRVDDNLIATFDASALTLGGNNIALGASDINTSTARHPALVFSVFDNLQVESIVNVVAGDFDADGKVDGTDFLKWQRGESPNNGSAGDLSDWQLHFGSGFAQAAATAAPEPTAIALALLAAPLLRRRRR